MGATVKIRKNQEKQEKSPGLPPRGLARAQPPPLRAAASEEPLEAVTAVESQKPLQRLRVKKSRAAPGPSDKEDEAGNEPARPP